MPHALSMPSTGLQALILCGPGSSFPTFTSNPDESPKALLPIANRPMVWYPIDFCLRTGITSITLICPPSASKALTTALNTNPYLTALPFPRPDILAPAELNQNTGTAEILRLREVRELVEGDFIVLPCDLVCEFGGESLLQAWMVKSTSLTNLLDTKNFSNGDQIRHSGGLGVWYDTKTGTPVKGEETDFIATTPLLTSPPAPPKESIFSNITKLVYLMPTDSVNDLLQEKKALPVRHGLLKKNPRVRMYTTCRDAHIYIFPRWVLDFIQENERLDSIGEDVVGWWAKAGWQPGLVEKLHFREVCSDGYPDSENGSMLESRTSTLDSTPDDQAAPKENTSLVTVNVENQQAKDKTGSTTVWSKFEPPSILAYIHPNKGKEPGSILRRVDTAQLLLSVSLQLAKLLSVEEAGSEAASPFAHARKIAYPEGVKLRTTITKQDSLIAENVTVEEKTSIKECVVGANCQIMEGAKLSLCLLMEGVVVGKGCKLSKCILGKRCIIGDGSVLTDCEVQENLLVEAQTEDKDSKLMSSEGLEATEAEMDQVLQEMAQEVAAVADEAIADNGALVDPRRSFVRLCLPLSLKAACSLHPSQGHVPTRPVYAHPGASSDKHGVQLSSRPSPQKKGSVGRQQTQALLARLLQLPPELQFSILSCLDFGDIERLRRTCHLFRDSIDKAMIRRLFPDLREELLATCYLCLARKGNGAALVRAEETDARFPLASRCFDCVAQRSGFMVGRKYMLGNLMSVWVCRWCGYPVSTYAAWNQPEFHVNCFQKYNRVLLLYFLLGCAQWAIVIVGAVLCWRYFMDDKMVLGPTVVNFILAFWVFVLSVLRGAVLRTYHWALILEAAILALWIPPVFAIAGHMSKLPGQPSKPTLGTLGFIGINMVFRLLNVTGNLLLVFEWKTWRRNKPKAPFVWRLVNKALTILAFWADPQSMEQDYPATWWFKRGRRRMNQHEV